MVAAVSLLVGAKLLNVQVPFIFKSLVDYLNLHTGEALTLAEPVSAVSTYATALVLGCEWGGGEQTGGRGGGRRMPGRKGTDWGEFH